MGYPTAAVIISRAPRTFHAPSAYLQVKPLRPHLVALLRRAGELVAQKNSHVQQFVERRNVKRHLGYFHQLLSDEPALFQQLFGNCLASKTTRVPIT